MTNRLPSYRVISNPARLVVPRWHPRLISSERFDDLFLGDELRTRVTERLDGSDKNSMLDHSVPSSLSREQYYLLKA